MLKCLVTYLGRKKNPSFTLDKNVDDAMMYSFLWSKTMALLRGLKMINIFSPIKFIFLGNNVNIIGKKFFHYGKAIQIGDNVQIIANGKQGFFIDDHSWIGGNSYLKVSFSFNELGEFIRIGKHVGIGEFAHLGGAGGLTIDDDCIIGPYFSCHPENHSFNVNDELIRLQPVSRKGIYISRNCWIGAKVTILDGVTIGENCVIAAGAVVTKDMQPNSIIGGVPAKVIRNRNATEEMISSMKMAG